MALTITATAGSASANSFVTEGEAITYMASRLNAGDWTTASGADATETEKKALIEATRALDLLAWEGVRVTDTQALSWPRDYAVNPDATISDPGTEYPYYADTVIPQRVKDATCELALELLRANADSRDVLARDPDAVVKRKKTDVLETEYFEAPNATGWAAFPRIVTLVSPLIGASGGIVRT